MPPVVVFCFAGRRPNVELQLPFMRRLIEEHPSVEVAYWNLARTAEDRQWLPTIAGGRITVRNDLHWNEKYDGTGFGYAPVYGWYTQPQYSDHVLVKIDDDVVFAQTNRFTQFIEAAQRYPDRVVSANIVNNGACTGLIGMWDRFVKLGVPLLDIHVSNRYAQTAHQYFFDNYERLLHAPLRLVPTRDWLSINCLALSHPMLCAVSDRVGGPQPKYISDRMMQEWGPKIGDEGAVNELDRVVVAGFMVAHLTFGPQLVGDGQADGWRARYRDIGAAYLAGRVKEQESWLPDQLSDAVHFYPLAPGDANTRTGWRARYAGPGWSRRKIIRAIAPTPTVRRKLLTADHEQLHAVFATMMACGSANRAAEFARKWANCRTPEQEQALVQTWLPDALPAAR